MEAHMITMDTHTHTEVQAPTLSELAGYVYDQFESFTREGSDDTIYKTRDGSPQWITDMIMEAHGDMLPDDHKYEMIHTAFGAIHDSGADNEDEFSYNGADVEAAESCVSVYTHDRYAWLSSNLTRADYVEEFHSEFGTEGGTDPGELAGQGWYMEAREVVSSVVRSLTDRLEEIADDMPDADDFDGEPSSLGHAPRLTRALSAEREYADALAEWREEYPEVAVIEAGR